MKQLLTLCLLSILSLSSYAQSKPTKQQTIDYIDKTLKMSIGYKVYSVSDNKRVISGLITAYSFSHTGVDEKKQEKDLVDGETSNWHKTYSNVNWESLSSVDVDKENSLWRDDELAVINIEFTTKVKLDYYRNGIEVTMGDAVRYPNSFALFVLKTKADSIKKALERLAEIAKEENKDPF
jgi:hypothetical protein